MSPNSRLVPLRAASDERRYGGKAAQLAAALSAGLPVPDGWALDWETVAQLAADHSEDGSATLTRALAREVDHTGPLAVRSSAVGEDSAGASFAGLHVSVLGVSSRGVAAAVREVHGSASTPAATSYRRELGLAGPARMGVVVQVMVDADIAGVLFTRNPLTGATEIIVEASWGLGESVVGGIVTPDHLRLDRQGRLLELVPGHKDVELRLRADGTTEERAVPAHLTGVPCLTEAHRRSLLTLALECDEVYGDTGHDLEFAFAADRVFLLQRRPITRG